MTICLVLAIKNICRNILTNKNLFMHTVKGLLKKLNPHAIKHLTYCISYFKNSSKFKLPHLTINCDEP